MLIFICAGVAVGSAAMAIHIESLFTNSYDSWTTPITIVSSSIILFGTFLIIWGLIGDRARGRKRCPKCWYDMSGAVGLQCPECGITAKSERAFLKSKRPKWTFVIALCMFMIGGYGFSVNRRITQSESWFAAVPSWVLMAGWDWLPEDWITWEQSPFSGNLQERISKSSRDFRNPWIADWRVRRFGRRLCKAMLDDRDSRWDRQRLLLISAASDVITSTRSPDEQYPTMPNYEWIGPPIDAQALYLISAEEAIKALATQEPTMKDDEILDLLSGWYWGSGIDPYSLSKQWMLEALHAQDDYEYDTDDPHAWSVYSDRIDQQHREQIAAVFKSHRQLMDDPQFLENLVSIDEVRQTAAWMLIEDAGAIELSFDLLLDSTPHPNQTTPRERAELLGMQHDMMARLVLDKLLASLEVMFQGSDPLDHAHALTVFTWFVEWQETAQFTENPLFDRVFELALDRSLHIHKPIYPGEKPWRTFHRHGLRLLIAIDDTGQRAYPMIAQELLANPSRILDLGYGNDPFGSTIHIKAWVENFAQFANDNDPQIREWVIENLPVELGSDYDDLLDQIAVRFLNDPVMYINIAAEQKLFERLAENLICH